jgi:hypothetical protein
VFGLVVIGQGIDFFIDKFDCVVRERPQGRQHTLVISIYSSNGGGTGTKPPMIAKLIALKAVGKANNTKSKYKKLPIHF